MTKIALRLLAIAAIAGMPAWDNPITYILSTTGTGSIGSTNFSNTPITITSVADTSNVFVTSPGIYTVIPESSTLNIAGLPSIAFTDPMFWDDPTGSGDIGFGDDVAPFDHALGFTKLFSGLESYNLQSSFGPVFSSLDFSSFLGAFQNVPTSAGPLHLTAADDTFEAVTNSTTLSGFQGGPASAPVPIPLGAPISAISGFIGDAGTAEFYSFLWAGGPFSATASVTGAPGKRATYLFSEGLSSNCADGASVPLVNTNGYSNTLAIANLAPGQYCIGLTAPPIADPAFTINLNTPLEISDVPEPPASALLAIGIAALLAITWRASRRLNPHTDRSR